MANEGISRRQCASLVSTAAIGAALAPHAFAQAAAAGAGISSPPADFDPLPFVNPELRPMIASALPMMRGSVTTKEAVIAARSSRSPLERAPSTGVSIAEKRIPGKPGDPDVRIYIVNAGPKAQARPAILHIHGGGYILGTAASGLADLQDLARDLDCVIVTVDYRLAPETAFPGPLEDCYAGLKWLHANVGALGVDPARIAVKGESAGGGLAAMLAIAARDRKEVPLAYQCLIYPMLDDRTGSTVHRPPQQGALMWTPQSNRFGWSSFLGIPAGSPQVPAGAVPARTANLEGLPPAFIGVGTIDLFYEENLEYARRLAAAGVQVELAIAPGAFHGFTLVRQAKLVQRYESHMMAALRDGLGLPPA